jgi:hypothetical protein
MAYQSPEARSLTRKTGSFVATQHRNFAGLQ